MTRILIIDDEPIYSSTLAIHLSSKGYEVVIEDGGKSGLQYVAANPAIDLIMLDLMMPDMYGLDVLSKLKNTPSLKHIPVILQTGMLSEDEIDKGLLMGASYCLRKPFSRKELFMVIIEVLAGRKIIR